MMMLKIGQLCYLHLKNLKGGGSPKNLFIFGSPKLIPIRKQAIQILYMGKHFPFPINSKAWGIPKLQG
jgi:hypothetical protein